MTPTKPNASQQPHAPVPLRSRWYARLNGLRPTRAWSDLEWPRGLRGGLSIGASLAVCRLLGVPEGLVAVGAFFVVLADNGGPYRSRLKTISMILLGGLAAILCGALASGSLGRMLVVTALICFAGTYTRVVSPHISRTSVLNLIIYFAVLGPKPQSLHATAVNTGLFAIGWLWGASLCLLLWPLDAFRPARLAVAQCYRELAAFAADIARRANAIGADELPGFATATASSPGVLSPSAGGVSPPLTHAEHGTDSEPDKLRSATVEHQRSMRTALEAAREALQQTRARAAVRTLRARNLSVLLEVADILFASTMRAEELAGLDGLGNPLDATLLQVQTTDAELNSLSKSYTPRENFAQLPEYDLLNKAGIRPVRDAVAQWARRAATAYTAVAEALTHRPPDAGLSFAPEGSHRVDHDRASLLDQPAGTPSAWHYLAAEERESREALGLAYDALYSIWSGLEQPLPEPLRQRLVAVAKAGRGWGESLRANWTLRSSMMQHALRLTVVGCADALLMHLLHVNHGFWLAMTSLIVLQPNVAHTLQRSLQRVAGTLTGGVLAALFAATLQEQPLLIAVITVCSVLTCAFYAVDYAWYCVFLTPTFVLSDLPRIHDWHFAGVRVAMTLLGVGTALAAMRVLWPASERIALSGFFARCCAADAAYARSILTLWQGRDSTTEAALRKEVASHRRACGLASNDAEECVERVMLEPIALSARGFAAVSTNDAPYRDAPPISTPWQHELAFVTYIRRLTQSLLAFARLGRGEPESAIRLDLIAVRLESLSSTVTAGPASAAQLRPIARPMDDTLDAAASQQLRRIERQVAVLERAVAAMAKQAG
jgi:uncharacterized membrane protein YccC